MAKNSQISKSRVSKQKQQGRGRLLIPDNSVTAAHLTKGAILSILPAGTALPYRGGIVPSGFLLEDGSVLSQLSFPELFTAIGTLYNTGGEGVGNFRLPDSRGRIDIGAGTGSGLTNRALGEANKFGNEAESLSTAQMPSHDHSISHTHGSSGVGGTISFTGYGPLTVGPPNIYPQCGFNGFNGTAIGVGHSLTASGQSHAGNSSSSGSGSTHNNMPPCLAATRIIKY